MRHTINPYKILCKLLIIIKWSSESLSFKCSCLGSVIHSELSFPPHSDGCILYIRGGINGIIRAMICYCVLKHFPISLVASFFKLVGQIILSISECILALLSCSSLAKISKPLVSFLRNIKTRENVCWRPEADPLFREA